MSVLDVLDATRLCARWSESLADPAAWARPVAVRQHPTPVPHPEHSWWSLARNPQAMLMTGVVAAVVAKDAVLRVLEAGR